MKILLKNATLLPMYGYGARLVSVLIQDEKIKKITEEPLADTSFDETIDCGGNLLIPAFYNAHCHAAMTLFRGYGEDLPLQEWLEKRIYPAEDRLTYRSVFTATCLASAEMIRNGIVSFTDMYFFEDAVGEAVLETGIKANIARCIVSFDPNESKEDNYRFTEAMKLASDYHNKGNGRLMVDLSLHAEYTNTERCARYVAEAALENQLRIQIHLSETEKEHLECIGRHGKTPTEFFDDCGVFDAPTTAAHCIWTTDHDMDILKEKNVTVAHNPISNLKLGSGVMPLRKMLDKGIHVALGTDGVASNNRLDLLREMQTTVILQKGTFRDPAILKAEELVPLATRNGALSQGREDCGLVKEGYRADLILINRDSINNLPSYDDYSMLAYSAESRDVMMTMADGRILYRNGEYTSIDEERLKYEFKDVVAHYFD